MKGNSFVLVIVLIVGVILAIWGLWARSGAGGAASEMQKDSLLKGEAVFWAEQQAYFRIRSGQWEKSTDLFDSPFTPIATAEAVEMLNKHFDTSNDPYFTAENTERAEAKSNAPKGSESGSPHNEN
jgi:hypothetical protein